MTTEPHAGRPRRRRHAAAGGRILVAGMSAGAAILLVGVMGAPRSGQPGGQPDPPAAVAVRQPVGDGAGVRSVPTAPLVTPSDAPPVTTSQAS
jgi:hypothetical protein